MLIPAAIGWFKAKRQTSRLTSYHRKLNRYGKGNIEQLNMSYNKLVDDYSEGKINNEQFTNLKTEISILYGEFFKRRIDSSNGNGILLDKVKDEIKDAYSKGKLSEQHYTNLNDEISILYEEIFKKKIEALIYKKSLEISGNRLFLDGIKNDIKDAYSKGKLNEQHYKLLIEKISDSRNNHGVINKQSSSPESTSTTQVQSEDNK